MKFNISKEGRTISATQEELVCKLCKLKVESLDQRSWYFYDNQLSKGLYCESCAKNKEVFIDENNHYWLIDKFKPVFNEAKQNGKGKGI